jgi:hypothetical protein
MTPEQYKERRRLEAQGVAAEINFLRRKTADADARGKIREEELALMDNLRQLYRSSVEAARDSEKAAIAVADHFHTAFRQFLEITLPKKDVPIYRIDGYSPDLTHVVVRFKDDMMQAGFSEEVIDGLNFYWFMWQRPDILNKFIQVHRAWYGSFNGHTFGFYVGSQFYDLRNHNFLRTFQYDCDHVAMKKHAQLLDDREKKQAKAEALHQEYEAAAQALETFSLEQLRKEHDTAASLRSEVEHLESHLAMLHETIGMLS